MGEGLHDIGGARIRIDRRGRWLLVDERVAGVHVNGRPVRRCAWLRPGDSLHVGGHAILLAGTVEPAPPAAAAMPVRAGGEVRLVMRAVGGRHHGRGFTLGRGCLVGSDPAADIRLGPPLAARHARIAVEAGRVVLRGLAAGTSTVNGEVVGDAELRPGDQVLFGSGDRFVLEAPSPAPVLPEPEAPVVIQVPTGQRRRRLPWLLVAAVLIAAALSALLLL